MFTTVGPVCTYACLGDAEFKVFDAKDEDSQVFSIMVNIGLFDSN